MDASFLNYLHQWVFKCLRAIWLLPFFAVSLTQPGWGQDQMSSTPVSQSQENKWISGPAKTSLGAFADLQIPTGYRFTDAEGARSLLKGMNNPVPAGLIGILAPNSGEWMAVFEFNAVGYVKDANKDALDSEAILKEIQVRSEAQNKNQSKEGSVVTASMNWERQPVYNEEDHSLEWAIRAEIPSGNLINHTLVFLGRRGILDATMVRVYEGSKVSSDFSPLKQLAKNISFKDGQGYADYQKGDKIAAISLAKLVVNDENPAASNDLTASASAGDFAWIHYYYIFAGGVVIIGGLFFLKKLAMHRRRSPVDANEKPSSAAAPALSKNGTGLNGVKLNGSDGHSGRKKRDNFHKFYASMVQELSSSSSTGGYLPKNGDSATRSPKATSLLNNPPSDQAFASANLELIAMQKNLIEEQRRLMQQQSKLIEDKNKLIEEQNHFLNRQSEMIESQYSLKLT